MDLPQFLKDLCEEGRVVVPPISPLSEEELAGADHVLCQIELQYRLQVPGTAPDLDLEAARKAAILAYRACQFAAFRDYGPDLIDQYLASKNGHDDQPSTHYSADLTLRFLPDIFRFAKSAAKQDPLLDRLLGLGRNWPLSSVGMGKLGELAIEGIVAHPSLLTLYVDRIIERRDTSRLDDPRVAEATRGALGAFRELAPDIAAAVFGTGVDPTDGISAGSS